MIITKIKDINNNQLFFCDLRIGDIFIFNTNQEKLKDKVFMKIKNDTTFNENNAFCLTTKHLFNVDCYAHVKQYSEVINLVFDKDKFI